MKVAIFAGKLLTLKAAFSLAMTSLCQQYKLFAIYYFSFSVFSDGQYESNSYPILKQSEFFNNDLSVTNAKRIRNFISVEYVTRQIVNGLKFEDIGVSEPSTLNIRAGKSQTISRFCQHYWKNVRLVVFQK